MPRPRLVLNPLSGPLLNTDLSRRSWGYEAARPISVAPRGPSSRRPRGFDGVPCGSFPTLPPSTVRPTPSPLVLLLRSRRRRTPNPESP